MIDLPPQSQYAIFCSKTKIFSLLLLCLERGEREREREIFFLRGFLQGFRICCLLCVNWQRSYVYIYIYTHLLELGKRDGWNYR